MLRIGEFSKLSHLTVKALRFYEKEGLLIPKDIDQWTGYRLYETGQLADAARIKSYRQLDLSIEEIKEIFSGTDVRKILIEKAEKLKMQKEEIDIRLSIINHIQFREIPVTKVLSIFHKGAYDQIGEAYAFIMNYAEKNGYRIAGLARECYIDGIWNKDTMEEWLTEIQLPIE